jgi:Tol biopolymer transport system component
VFAATRNGREGVFRQRADGNGTEEQLASDETGVAVQPESWTPDGSRLLGSSASGGVRSIWMITLGENSVMKPLSLGDSPGNKTAPAVSPDGKWVAYGSTENRTGGGGFNVFVQPFPPTGAKYQVTTIASSTPVWSADGRQLLVAYYYELFSVDVSSRAGFSFDRAKPLRADGIVQSGPIVRNFDLAADGRIVVLLTDSAKTNDGQSSERINVILNWHEELKRLVQNR